PNADEHGFACKAAGRRAAAYDPRRDRWRRIDVPRALAPVHTEPSTDGVGWTGKLAVFRVSDRDTSLWAYAPATERWSKLATPGSLEDSLVCSHGGRVEILSIPQLGHGYCAGSHV